MKKNIFLLLSILVGLTMGSCGTPTAEDTIKDTYEAFADHDWDEMVQHMTVAPNEPLDEAQLDSVCTTLEQLMKDAPKVKKFEIVSCEKDTTDSVCNFTVKTLLDNGRSYTEAGRMFLDREAGWQMAVYKAPEDTTIVSHDTDSSTTQLFHVAYFAFTKVLAERGDARANLWLTAYYGGGVYVKRDSMMVFNLTQKSAELGYADAQVILGRYYRDGYGTAADTAKSFEWFKKAADQDYELAYGFVAEGYEQGLGVKKNEKAAFKWYMKAAKCGDLHSITHVGNCYGMGIGVRKDDKKSFEWTLKAAEMGDVVAQFNTASSYYSGKGVKASAEQALEWMLKAAEQGLPEAQYQLANFYFEGLGELPPNYGEAARWLKEALDNGVEDTDGLATLLED